MPKLIIGHEVIEFDYLRNFSIDMNLDAMGTEDDDHPIVEMRFRMPRKEAEKLRNEINKKAVNQWTELNCYKTYRTKKK